MDASGQAVASTDDLKWVLDGVQEQIRFADSKAAFVIALDTFVFGFLLSHAESLAGRGPQGANCLYWICLIILAICAAVSLVSMYFAIMAVVPQLGKTAPACNIFFGHIVSQYHRDYGGYCEAVNSASEEKWLKDITSQIVENSNIAMAKHGRAGRAARFAVGAVACTVLAAVLLVAHTASSHPKGGGSDLTSTVRSQ